MKSYSNLEKTQEAQPLDQNGTSLLTLLTDHKIPLIRGVGSFTHGLREGELTASLAVLRTACLSLKIRS